MKQALHILKKDVRHLRYDIAITLAAAIVFIAASLHNTSGLGSILPVTWWFLIARLVHAEAIPGHRQFWITRPYRWKSLLGAKLLFIALFVNLPLLIADAVIIHSAGFSVMHQLPGLLWTQVLTIAAFVLPAAAFSAVTSGLPELLSATLIVVLGVLARLFGTFWISWGSFWFELEWVRTYCLVGQLAAGAAIILLWQYARRATTKMRLVAGGTAFLLLITNALLPWTAAFALQTRLVRRDATLQSIRVSLDSGRKWLGRIYASEEDQVTVELPLQISGVPSGMDVKPQGLTLAIKAANGASWTAKQAPPETLNFEANIISLKAVVSKSFYAKVKDQTLRLQGKLYVTLYERRPGIPIPLNGRPVPVDATGVCSAGTHFINCNSAFRSPSDLIRIRVLQDGPRGTITSLENRFGRTSFSPFPAELSLDPLTQSFFPPPMTSISGVQVETSAPIAHIAQPFDIDQVSLKDFSTSSSLATMK